MKTFTFGIFALTLFVALSSRAGSMSELLIAHTEGIEAEVKQWGSFSFLGEASPQFVEPSGDFELAIQSQVDVMDERTGEIFEVACTSYFEKDSGRRFRLVATNCEYPE